MALDLSGLKSHTCVCGSTRFKTLIALDPETNRPGWWLLHGYCYDCGSRVEFPEPTDG